jgi:hypothetical protein
MSQHSVEVKRMAFRFQAACLAEAQRVPSPSEPADALCAALESADTSGACDLVRDGLEAIVDLVGGLPRNRRYVPMLIAAEALASSLVWSDTYQDVVHRWSHHPDPSPRTIAARACSRLADVDPLRVDVDLLFDLTSRLDAMGNFEQNQVTLSHVALAAAKLRDLPDGVRFTERLAEQGSASRCVAALAIAADVGVDPPPCYMSVFASHAPRSNPPPRYLLGLLASLIEDPDALVQDAAARAVQGMQRSWPEFFKLLISIRYSSWGSPPVPPSPRPPAPSGTPTHNGPGDPDVAVGEADPAHAAVPPAARHALRDLNQRSNRRWTIDDLPRL